MKEGLNNNSWFVLCSQEACGSEPLQGFSSAIGFPFLYNVVSSLYKMRPTLGIQAASIKAGDPITDAFSAPQNCVLVAEVNQGGASDGVLQMGDLILTINGTAVTHMDDLKAALYNCRMGDTILLQVNRFGEILNLTITFGAGN